MRQLCLLLMVGLSLPAVLPAQSPNPILRPPGFEPRFPYSPGVVAGELVFLAGQGSRDPKTGRHPEGFEAQVRQAIENLRAVLEAGNMDLRNLASCHVYLDDLGNYARMNSVYGEMMKEASPVRTTIAMPALPDESHVEIACIAARNAAMKKPVSRDGKPPAKPGLFPPGVQVGDWLFTSGAGSRNPVTGQHPEGFEAQVKQVMENLGEVLKAGGVGYPNVVWANIYLDDAANIAATDQVFNSCFENGKRARTVSIVRTIPGDSHVEITLLAASADALKAGKAAATHTRPSQPGATAADLVLREGERRVRVGPLFLSAQSAPGGTIEDQVRAILETHKKTLAPMQMDLSNVVNANVYLKDIADFPKMNAVYRQFFPNDPPARTTVQVKQPGSSPGALVEISLVAFKPALPI
jgi:2-iminobutanoate/2-iminopropanoate deaminase